jgi:tetratricopeptide (TPR) repeat protein
MQEQILDALRRGAHDEAVGLARDALAASPQDAGLHRLLAMAQRAAGDAEGAFASIDRAIALAPDDADLHFQRAGFLVGVRKMADAQAALARTIVLDPNLFGAYILQAQLALGRGDLGEAERLQRLAERIAPEHPWQLALEGTLALRRGDPDRALSILTSASEREPDDVQLRYALGFAYLAKEHLAFAEQAFRGVLEKTPEAGGLRGLIAELLRRQGRYADAAEELAPLLADAATATPAVRRFAGELELMAGRHERALPLLREAFAAQPGDARILNAITEAWRRHGDAEEPRNMLDAALATSPRFDALWRARLLFEPARESTGAIIERWIAARPDHVPALEARMAFEAMSGDEAAANATAERIIAIEPGRSSAEMRLLDELMRREPGAAVERIEHHLKRAETEEARRLLRGWKGLAQDRAGSTTDAVATWSGLHAEVVAQRLPLPDSSAPRADWPELATAAETAPAVALLWGPPGSRVERLATVLAGTLPSFRADRYGASPPADALQSYFTVPKLLSGEQDGAAVVSSWRELLPSRGIADGQVVDWLLWWDNALLLALRPHLPEAVLLIAVRDPRDMLLDWLAFGSPAPYAMKSPIGVAGWLAVVLNQVAFLHEQDLFPHSLLRLDGIADDPRALAEALGAALQTRLPVPPPAAPGAEHFAPGRWRAYADALAEPFAMLTPVARRLGYAEA